MNIGILGTGIVGTTLGTKLTQVGHAVRMGARERDNPKAAAWAEASGPRASQGSFADAALFGEVVLNCTLGQASVEALQQAGEESLQGKILIDLSNPLDFSHGMPPSLTICNTDSLGEQIQKAFPEVKVVKALNTMTCAIMVDPRTVPGDHNVFLSGNDAAAKAEVATLLSDWFGWKAENVIDLGDITTARGAEMLLPLWVRLMGALHTPMFNFHVVVAPKG